jgi:hypothetical protein
MRAVRRLGWGAVLGTVLLGCNDSAAPRTGGQVPPPAVLLKDIVIPVLPSPYYHFEYDSTGRMTAVSFASNFTMYQVIWQVDRISELQNGTLGNQDRLEYTYDGNGRVSRVDYVHPDDSVFTRVWLSYEGARLIGLTRELLLDGSFVTDKTLKFTYYPDGNLKDLTDHRPAIAGFQTDNTTSDRFEQYDDKVNVDAFGLVHNDFFDHLVLLPGVTLQKGNPARVTRTGDGTNYRVDNVYDYDGQGRPRSVTGDVLLTNGPDAGTHVQTLSTFTYY